MFLSNKKDDYQDFHLNSFKITKISFKLILSFFYNINVSSRIKLNIYPTVLPFFFVFNRLHKVSVAKISKNTNNYKLSTNTEIEVPFQVRHLMID